MRGKYCFNRFLIFRSAKGVEIIWIVKTAQYNVYKWKGKVSVVETADFRKLAKTKIKDTKTKLIVPYVA